MAFLPSHKTNYLNTKYDGGSMRSIDLEYTYLHDNHSYYNGTFYGFTTGIKHITSKNKLTSVEGVVTEELQTIAIPLLLTIKENEWNDVLRVGFVTGYHYKKSTDDNYAWNTRPYTVDLYMSFGFDNRVIRYRTDGWMWSLEVFGQYNVTNHTYKESDSHKAVRLLRVGARVGIVYQFDYYHYRRWTR